MLWAWPAAAARRRTMMCANERPQASYLLVKPARKQTEVCSATEQGIAGSRVDRRVLRLWLARVTSDVVVRLQLRPHHCPKDEDPESDRPGYANHPVIVANCSTITYPPHESLQQIYILHEDGSRSYPLLSYSIDQRYSIVLQKSPTDLQAASRSPS